MFAYILSVCVAFVVFGSGLNVYCKVKGEAINKEPFFWMLVFCAAVAYPLVIVAGTVLFVVYLLKLLTDKIAEVIINHIKTRKLKKFQKELDNSKVDNLD